MTQDLRKKPEVNKPYDYDLDLNWRDDGDILGDASMNDYLKGYKNEPYAFQQWAKNKGINTKVAGQEMINMHFYPEFLADYILTLWNGTDGELQNFYEAFTLRYDNKLKKAVADEIEKLGYKVYPVLVDDRAFYAKKQFSKIVKMAKNKNIQTKLNISKHLFENSEALKLCLGEIDDIQEMGVNVSAKRVSDLLDYYSVIFPEDYAICLTKDLVDEKINDKGYEHYQDFNISDESLKNIERMMDGNQDPYDAPYNGGNTSNTDMGYDYITDMRGFDGVKPEMYEAPAVHAKEKD